MLVQILGPAIFQVNEMSQWVLKANVDVVPRQTPRPLNTAELHSSAVNKKHETFDALIESRRGASINPENAPNEPKYF